MSLVTKSGIMSTFFLFACLVLLFFSPSDARPQGHQPRPPRPTRRDLVRRQEDWDIEGQPCGQVFRWAREALDAGLYPIFPAYPVYQCLISVPFNDAVALRFLDYFNTTMQFQSTLAYLRDPPEGYQRPALDVMAQLDIVKAKVLAGAYTREYDFELDVNNIVSAMHDGHVDIDFGILVPFNFGSMWEIVSVSRDGKELPKPYFREDITDAQNDNWAWEPSPISQINGIDAVEFLKQSAANFSFGNLEAHADYNQLFEHPASDIQLDYGVWSGQIDVYPGTDENDWLDFTLENGTEILSEWWAELKYFQDTGPLETGGDMYNFFVLGLLPASYNGSDALTNPEDFGPEPEDTTPSTWFDETLGAYPRNPDVIQANLSVKHGGVVTGYFLDDVSTGVLSLPTFTQFGEEVDEFSSTVQEFIDGAASKGLTRIVIDVQQNNGGETKLAFDIFKRFFPQHDIFAGSRRRSHPLGTILGSFMTEWWETLDTEADDFWEIAGNEWVITPRIDASTNQNFPSWAEFDSATQDRGDSFSKVERYNLSDEVFTYAAFTGDFPYGFGLNPINTTERFKPEDIVILTDGLCNSACSIFVEAMTRMGVKTLSLGGLPEYGPMQAVAGSRGARAYSANSIDDIMAFASNRNESLRQALPVIPHFSEVRDHGIRTSYLGINLRDQVRSSSPDEIPLQFRYEAADCRLFYTLRNIYNLTQLWTDVSNAAFDNTGSLCIQDSTGYSSSPGNPAPLSPPALSPSAYSNLPPEPTYSSTDLESYDGPPPFDDGDLNSGHRRIASKDLLECNSTPGPNSKPCDGRFACTKVPVKCRSLTQKPKQAFTELCLPICETANDNNCRQFDDQEPRLGANFVCDAFGAVNTKSTTRGRGTEPDGRTRYKGICLTQSIIWPGTCS
ncbi:hypothetical protein V8F33_008842 [Rhypophila sp. PSN 637]